MTIINLKNQCPVALYKYVPAGIGSGILYPFAVFLGCFFGGMVVRAKCNVSMPIVPFTIDLQ